MKQLHLILLVFLLVLSGCAQQSVEEEKTVFYPPPPTLPKIQYLFTLIKQSDIGPEQSDFERFLLGPEVEFTGVVRPYDISSSRGKIYVLDRMHNKIFIFDLVQQQLNVLEDSSHPNGSILYAGGIWVDADGSQYIADMERKQILVFDAANKYFGAYGDDTVFEKPSDVAVFNNMIYVCDYKKQVVLVLDKKSGKVIQEIGNSGPEDQRLDRPTHVTVDDKGFIYVTDAFNFKIKKFGPDGTLVQAFGDIGDTIGTFARPKGVAVDLDGNVYVVDAASEQAQIFNSEAQLLMFFGGPGTSIENLWLPAGVSIDYENVDFFQSFADKDFKVKYLIYIASMAGPGRTNVYGFGEWTGESRRIDEMGSVSDIENDGNQVQEVQ